MAGIFTEEHQMFREQVRKYIDKEIVPYVDQWEAEKSFPKEVFRKLGSQGFFGIKFPEEYGGIGADKIMATVWIEECQRTLSGGMNAGLIMHSEIVINQIFEIGNEEQRQKYLVPGIKGEKVGCLGLTEPSAGSDLASIRTRAVRDGEYFIINGSKMFITNGKKADFVLLFTRTDPEAGYAGYTTFIVDTDTPGFSVSRTLDKVGWWAGDTAELVLEDVKVHESQILGQEGGGFMNVMRGLQWERLIMAIGSTAAAQLSWEKAKKYCEERVQFKKPLIDFQVTRHKLAHMLTEIEICRELCYDCLWKIVNDINCQMDVTAAKIFCCEATNRIADTCFQLYGGYGFMMEYPVQRFWRDSRLGTIGGGTTEVQKEILTKLMGL